MFIEKNRIFCYSHLRKLGLRYCAACDNVIGFIVKDEFLARAWRELGLLKFDDQPAPPLVNERAWPGLPV